MYYSYNTGPSQQPLTPLARKLTGRLTSNTRPSSSQDPQQHFLVKRPRTSRVRDPHGPAPEPGAPRPGRHGGLLTVTGTPKKKGFLTSQDAQTHNFISASVLNFCCLTSACSDSTRFVCELCGFLSALSLSYTVSLPALSLSYTVSLPALSLSYTVSLSLSLRLPQDGRVRVT